MELLIQLLMLFIIIGTILKQSFARPTQSILFGLGCGAFILLSYPYAIEQTKTGIAAYLGNRELRETMAIIISVEALAYALFAFRSEKPRNTDSLIGWVRKSLSYYLPILYPGVLILPVLFYLQTSLIFALAGVDFALISIILALLIAIGIPSLALLVRSALPEEALREEVLFLASLFIFALGVLTSVDDKVMYAPTPSGVNWIEVVVASAFSLLFFLLGRYGYLFARILKRNNQ